MIGHSAEYKTVTSGFHCKNGTVSLLDSYVAGFVSGGEIHDCDTQISSSSFTGFPGSEQYVPQMLHSNGLSIRGGDVEIEDSVFMLANDNCLELSPDTGARIIRTRFERCYHECLTVSIAPDDKRGALAKEKEVNIINSVFDGCQQGLELGASHINTQVNANHCLFRDNLVGVRLGDSQEEIVEGKILVENSVFSENHEDTWNFIRLTSRAGHLEIRYSLFEEYAETAKNENHNFGEYPILFSEPHYLHIIGNKSLAWKSASDGRSMGLVYPID
eukprot:TRINITY_DN4172_c0_g1_i3.p1 TRINITY_DN4172_c0_g1~~TRINITY_DN4172_c0_g1_i3.p1  ORF type:complete len:274 (-),score=34.47 TRINITY_DN4172_c0_g1_i3:118-939(-)